MGILKIESMGIEEPGVFAALLLIGAVAAVLSFLFPGK